MSKEKSFTHVIITYAFVFSQKSIDIVPIVPTWTNCVCVLDELIKLKPNGESTSVGLYSGA